MLTEIASLVRLYHAGAAQQEIDGQGLRGISEVHVNASKVSDKRVFNHFQTAHHMIMLSTAVLGLDLGAIRLCAWCS